MTENLQNQKCEPCSIGTPKMEQTEIDKNLKEVPGWQQVENKIQKNYTFKDFVHLMEFTNKMADVAEQEGHHPDFHVSYNKLNVMIYTHKIDGLSINDFILAAKIDKLPR